VFQFLTAIVMVSSALLPGVAPANAVVAGEDPAEGEPPMAEAQFSWLAVTLEEAAAAMLAAVAIPHLIEARKGSNEAAAIGALRTISTAQSLYREGDKDGNGIMDYAEEFSELLEHGLVDDVLGTGAKQGYIFELDTGSTAGNNSTIFLWNATATPAKPGRSGDRSFYVDETGILLGNDTCPTAGSNSTPIGGAAPQAVGDDNKQSCGADEAVRALIVGLLSAMDILSDGQLVEAMKALLTGNGDVILDGILIGLDTDGDEALSFHDLLEDPAVLQARFANMMGGGSQASSPGPTTPSSVDSFFDIFTDFSFAMGEELQLGLANEVVDFTVPFSTMRESAVEEALEVLDEVPTLDHFKCYASTGESVRDVVALQDQFDVMEETSMRAKVLDPEIFCNPTRKTLADGNATAIRNEDGHLTGYEIRPVFGGTSGAKDVVAYNQFGARQLLKVRGAELLLVPTQKALVDGGTPEAGAGVPEGLDHFKCYEVTSEGFQPRSVLLEDQFDVGQSPTKATVVKAVLLCNPTRKIHHDFEHDTSVSIQNAAGHLVCYEIRAPRHVRDLEVNNQFGDGQKITTGEAALLCVPSVKRVPRPKA